MERRRNPAVDAQPGWNLLESFIRATPSVI